MNLKKCPVCDTGFTGRSDKKFCSDHCRNAFNNKLNACTQKEIRDGFILTYFTNIHKNESESDVFFCYDLGYQLSENESVKVFTRKTYEQKLCQVSVE